MAYIGKTHKESVISIRVTTRSNTENLTDLLYRSKFMEETKEAIRNLGNVSKHLRFFRRESLAMKML